MQAAQAKIYVGEERGILEKENAQLFCVFEEENFINPHKKPFENLYRCNEILVDPAATVSRSANSHSYILLLPSMGAIICTLQDGHTVTIAAGQAYSFSLLANSSYTIENPFGDGVIGVVEIAYAISNHVVPIQTNPITYPISTTPNTILPITETGFFIKAGIGLFEGRKEAVYQYQSPQHRLFCFVLQGAFELEGRLLHPKDSLIIWDTQQIELEALSNNAIILLLEFPPSP